MEVALASTLVHSDRSIRNQMVYLSANGEVIGQFEERDLPSSLAAGKVPPDIALVCAVPKRIPPDLCQSSMARIGIALLKSVSDRWVCCGGHTARHKAQGQGRCISPKRIVGGIAQLR